MARSTKSAQADVQPDSAHAVLGTPEPRDGEPIFRAVMAQGERRGIRLERVFWKTLSAIAAARKETLGEVVAHAAGEVPDSPNLASALRVLAARWLSDRNAELRRLTAADSVFSIIHASPSPAFVLSADKRIVQYNQAFLNFLQARLLAAQSPDLMRSVRLTLDMQIEQVIELLAADPKTPVTTGFALGVAERRVRGQLKLVNAPVSAATMVIAFMTQV